ncbi:UvrD-helicase domain-containing protein [bacterium SCSIO 12741]|nr:UvrD-helicase domain-containing protein [bacterium SCSIO 12741]
MSLSVFRSSAGSGKTFTLVQEYLKIALTDAYESGISSILALTFTNKASNEMKERIIAALLQLADSKERHNSPHFSLLLEDPSLKLDATEIAIRSKNCLAQLLHNYSAFSVQTIDRFIHRIIRTFASELDLSNSFEVELDETRFLQEAITRLMDRASDDPDLMRFLTEFVLDRVSDDKNWRVEAELLNFARILLSEQAQPYVKQLLTVSEEDFLKAGKAWEKEVAELENQWVEWGEAGQGLILEQGLSESAFFYGSRGVPGLFKKLIRKDISNLFNSNVEKARSSDKWVSGKATAEEKQKIAGIKPELLVLMANTEESLENHLGRYKMLKLLSRNLYSMGLSQAISEEIEKLKKERNVVLISDFNRIISQFVAQESAPFIYERTAQHYQHFLIDEFQDTSNLQWKNLVPLLENSLAQGGKDLIVGDGKQAIYRWRGGDVDQFVYMPQLPNPNEDPILHEQLISLSHHIQEFNLENNYRSSPEVVNFNNELFERIVDEQPQLVKDIFLNHQQNPVREKPKGYVEIQFKPEEVDMNEWHSERLPNLLQELKADGYAWKDVCILCRKNKDLSYLASLLLKHDIPVISSEALLLFGSIEVKLVHAFLKVIAHPHQVHRQVEALTLWNQLNPDRATSHEVFQQLIRHPGLHTFSNALEDLGISLNLKLLLHANGYQLVETIICALHLDQSDNAYLSAYLNEVHNYFQSREMRLNGLITYLDERREKLSLSLPEGAEAVSLMTIHQSKGLEFPVVLFAYANWKYRLTEFTWLPLNEEQFGLPAGIVRTSKDLEFTPHKSRYEEELNKTKLDELNLLYVAVTRAAERLYVFTEDEGRNLYFAELFVPALRRMDGWQDITFVRGSKEPVIRESKADHSGEFHLEQLGSFPEDDRFIEALNSPATTPDPALEWHLKLQKKLAQVITPNDWDIVWESEIQALEKEEEQTIQRIENLHQELNNSAQFWGDRILNQPELQAPSGDQVRPDRVVMQQQEWQVIHYRMGKVKEKDKQEMVLGKHLVSRMTDKPVRSWIFHTDLETWTEV